MTLKPIVTASSMNSPVVDHVRCSAAENFCQSNQRAKLQMQTQQIDGAIHLLKMQYEAIMCNVRQNQEPANLQDRCLSQFDLPRPEWTMPCMAQSLQGNQYKTNLKEASVPDSCSAHRKRGAEDILNDDLSKKRSISSSGKLVLDSEVPFVFLSLFEIVILTQFLQTACAIYELRPKVWDRRGGKSQSQSAQIASSYGVTAKTIRDIW
jgi:hypothetical protein